MFLEQKLRDICWKKSQYRSLALGKATSIFWICRIVQLNHLRREFYDEKQNDLWKVTSPVWMGNEHVACIMTQVSCTLVVGHCNLNMSHRQIQPPEHIICLIPEIDSFKVRRKLIFESSDHLSCVNEPTVFGEVHQDSHCNREIFH